jgi:hypothetical protein
VDCSSCKKNWITKDISDTVHCPYCGYTDFDNKYTIEYDEKEDD